MRSKLLTFAAGVLLFSSCHGRHADESRRFTLPGWEDLRIGEAAPRDVELTCERTNEISECTPIRSTAAIKELQVLRRPDKYGVMRVMAVGVDAKLSAEIAKRWGPPTETSPEGPLWCADSAAYAAFIETDGMPAGANVLVTAIPEDVQRCLELKQHRAQPTRLPSSITATPIEGATPNGSGGRLPEKTYNTPADQRGVHVSQECLNNPLSKGCN